MFRLAKQRLARFEGEVARLLFPVLSRIEGEGDPGMRSDASIPRYVSARLQALELHLAEIFDEAELDRGLEVIGQRLAVANGREVKRVIGVSIFDAAPAVAAQLGNFRAINVSRIKSLAGEQLVEITQLLEESTARGARVEVVRKAIEDRFGVTRSKAALLARDQTLTINSQITRTRMVNAGVREYIWTSSGDERVRDRHAELDGTRQSWDAPPEVSDDGRVGHPGEDYQCRCTAFPVLPELTEETQQALLRPNI